jgi:hypothetical protein
VQLAVRRTGAAPQLLVDVPQDGMAVGSSLAEQLRQQRPLGARHRHEQVFGGHLRLAAPAGIGHRTVDHALRRTGDLSGWNVEVG